MNKDRYQVEYVDRQRVARVLAQFPNAASLAGVADIFRVLSDPNRLRLLLALASEELCVCDLAELVGTSASAVSHQLRLLRTARLVKHRREGKMVYYRLDDEHIGRLLQEGLKHAEEG